MKTDKLFWKSRILRPRYNAPGSRPGTLPAAVGTQAVLSVFDFNSTGFFEARDTSIAVCSEYFASKNVTWVHVQGQPNKELLGALAQTYGLHPLAIEDVSFCGQRTKMEVFDDQLFLVLYRPVSRDGEIFLFQISLFLGPGYIVSFCEGSDDPFDPVRVRVRAQPPGRIRQRGADYLLYAIIDLTIDNGFPVLDDISNRLEDLEAQILIAPAPKNLEQLHHVKRNLIVMRKQLWPQRDVLNALIRDDHSLITTKTLPYFRDCYDHAVRILEFVETYREMSSGIHDLYLSSLSNRMNDIMKVLTVIATIFMPMSFLTGVYGMNFNPEISPWNMPELNWYYGYPAVLLLISMIAAGLLAFFRWRHWF